MLNALKATIKWIAAIVIICAVAVFLANINGLSVSRKIATVGGNDVTEAEFKYYLEMIKDQMISEAGDSAGDDYWNSDIDGKKASDVAKEKAMEKLIRTETAIVKANEAGISLSDEEKANARSIVNSDDETTQQQLKDLEKKTGADKYQIADIMEKNFLASAYYQSLSEQENSPIKPDDEEIKSAANEKYAVVKHVLISNTPQEDVAAADPAADPTAVDPAADTADDAAEPAEEVDTEKYAEEAKAKAEEVLAKAVKGDNFEKLIEEYGEDPGMESSPDGYIIDETGATLDGSGSMIEEFTQGTFAVQPGEVNPNLIESTYGWHIIKRYPLPEDGEDLTQILSAASSSLMSDKYEVYIDSLKDSMNVTINEKIYNKIKVK